ncbi:MAG: hypothetical protein M0Z75_17365, partial [Nitrospiraceae bacterium]|nr:hypothetical protein [Nitrospiraceae bacterium]
MKKAIWFFVFITSLVSLCGISRASDYAYIKTGGFDYQGGLSGSKLQWLATHHDVIIGNPDASTASGYTTLKQSNPNVLLISYQPYTITASAASWMANWCIANGKNPEDLFYHYYYDTTVKMKNGTSYTFPGYGGGTAASLAQARVPSPWDAGLAICNSPYSAYGGAFCTSPDPSSPTFVSAFNAYILSKMITVGTGMYMDGVFLDSFDSLTDNYNNLHLENTIDMRNLGLLGNVAAANTRANSDWAAYASQLRTFLANATGKAGMIIPNMGDASYMYEWQPFAQLGADIKSATDPIGIETLITSGFYSTERIPWLVDLYNDMSSGYKFFINSQTNYASASAGSPPLSAAAWNGLQQFILATHYLIYNPNGYFSFHLGGEGYYGGDPSVYMWNANEEFNVGNPVTRQTADYWNATGTNRFFKAASGTNNDGTSYV